MHDVQCASKETACCAGQGSCPDQALQALEQVLQQRQLWQERHAITKDAVAGLKLIALRTNKLCLQYHIGCPTALLSDIGAAVMVALV